METYDIIIVGSGISGMSLAHFCAKGGLTTLVIEKDERIGGTFHSHRFSGEASGFWLELGAHTCYNSYGSLIDVLHDCHILDTLTKREKVGYKMLVNGQLKSIPSRMSFVELLFSAPRLFTQKKTGQTIESYYSRIVGKKNFRKVMAPLFDAVICQKANDFPADLLFKKRPRRKDILKSFTLTHGLQSITDAISVQPKISIIKGKGVQTVTTDNDLFHLTTGDGSTYTAQTLGVATDAIAAARLLKAPFPELSEQLSKIQVSTVESVGVALKRKALSLPPVAGLIAVEDSFYSAVSRDTVKHDTYRGLCFHFREGVLTHEAKLRRIADVLKVNLSQLEEVVSRENRVPSLSLGHERVISETDRLLTGKRLLLTGNYFSGLAIEDCVSRSMTEFLRLKRSV